jgi:hypothetical protein
LPAGRGQPSGLLSLEGRSPSADPDVELRDQIQRIALEFSYYGSRRVTRELHERGWRVNRKKVQRLMREDTCCVCASAGLLCRSPPEPAFASSAALRMLYIGPAVDDFAANGEQCLIWLSQPRGPPQPILNRPLMTMRIKSLGAAMYYSGAAAGGSVTDSL